MRDQRGSSCFFPLRMHHINTTTSGQGPRVPRLHEIHQLTGAMHHRKTSEMGLIVIAKVWGNRRDETHLMFLLGGTIISRDYSNFDFVQTARHDHVVTTCRHFIHDFRNVLATTTSSLVCPTFACRSGPGLRGGVPAICRQAHPIKCLAWIGAAERRKSPSPCGRIDFTANAHFTEDTHGSLTNVRFTFATSKTTFHLRTSTSFTMEDFQPLAGWVPTTRLSFR
jgi:hypothetical protein